MNPKVLLRHYNDDAKIYVEVSFSWNPKAHHTGTRVVIAEIMNSTPHHPRPPDDYVCLNFELHLNPLLERRW